MNADLPWLNAPPPTGVRLRFAPSPTGELHIGGARTALFNYMMAKRLGGQFLLRIEDTDAARSTPENTQVILDGLRWLGLHWDEGPEVEGPCAPYLQSQRSALYQKAVDWLLEKDRLYPCFLTMDEIEAMRMLALHEKRNFVQESPYAAHDPAELKARAAAGEPHNLRFRCPDKTVVVHDLLRGEVSFGARDMVGDLIVRRSDGGFTYNFVVVVDDEDRENARASADERSGGRTERVKERELCFCSDHLRHGNLQRDEPENGEERDEEDLFGFHIQENKRSRDLENNRTEHV